MKKFLLLGLLLCSLYSMAQQAKRHVLFEHFTQASCGPCADQNPAFQAFFEQNTTNAHHIAYHTAWPGDDPMNEDNPEEVDARVQYYGVGGVPAILVSGENETNPMAVDQSTVEGVSVGGSPIQMLVAETNDGSTLTTDVTIKTLANVPEGNWRLRVAVVEKMIEYASPPGTNGERDFPNVFRKMQPNTAGEAFTALSAGEETSITYETPIDDIWDATQIYAIAFIQNDDTGEVLNSAAVTDWDVNYVVNTPAGIQTAPSTTVEFLGTATVNTPETTILQIDVTTDAPADWSSVLSFPNYDLPLTSASLEFEGGATTDVGLKIITTETTGFATYTLRISQETDPSVYTEHTYYVNNGVTDLVVGNTNAFNNLYVDGLAYSTTDGYGKVGKGGFLYANELGILEGINNIYLNIGWTFPSLTDDIVAILSTFLDNGGNLLIAGQDVGWDTFTPDIGNGTPITMDFYTNYLQAGYIDDGSTVNSQLTPIQSEAIYGSLSPSTIIDAYNGNMYPDELAVVGTTAFPILNYNGDAAKIAGVRSDNSTFKTVCLGIGIEMIADETIRNEFMKLTHDWFNEGITSGTYDEAVRQLMISQNYPNPANATTTISLNNIAENMTFALTDVTGKTVWQQAVTKGTDQITINTQNFAEGVYIYQLKNETGVLQSKKLMVTH